MANKFNWHWQLVRVNARDIKDVDKKIEYVTNFLGQHKNAHNFERVHNWLRMTGVAYKGEQRQKFEEAVAAIENKKDQFASQEDMDNDLSKAPTEHLKKIYNDLSKRKYGFQFKSVPKAHTEFMADLKAELERR